MKQAASAVGINVGITKGVAWGIASGLAGAIGCLLGPVYGVYTTMGILIGQKGFAGCRFRWLRQYVWCNHRRYVLWLCRNFHLCIYFHELQGLHLLRHTHHYSDLHAYRHSEVQSFGIGRPRRIRYDKYTKKNALKKKIFLTAILIVVFGCMTAIAFGETYMALMFCRIGIYTIAVSGLDILFGYTGQISFGHAAFFAVGSYTSAYFSINMGWNPIFTMLIGVVFSMIVGAVIAIPATKLVKHFLSLLTIAFGQLVYTFANSTRPITGGASGLKDIPSISIFNFSFDTYAKSFIFIFILAVLLTIVKQNIVKSRTGRAFLAIRENTQAAYSSGINVQVYKTMAFVISAAYAGLAGGLYAHLINFISPDTFSSTQSTLFMTILLFGGMANLAGPLVGSVVLLTIKEFLQSFSTYQMMVYAVLILIVLFLLPNGISGECKVLFRKLLGKYKRRKNNA